MDIIKTIMVNPWLQGARRDEEERVLLYSDWKHRVRSWLNAAGIDLVPLARSPVAALRALRNLSIRTVLDVGANEGQFAKRATRMFPQATIHSFEPLPDPYRKLEKLARKRPQIKPIQIALGATEGKASMFRHIDYSPASSILATTALAESIQPLLRRQAPQSVSMRTLEAWFHDQESMLPKEILIKMDVQGYEDRVVRGGGAAFRAARACIAEVGLVGLYEGQASFASLVELLAKEGLHYAGNIDQVHDGQGRCLYADCLFLR